MRKFKWFDITVFVVICLFLYILAIATMTHAQESSPIYYKGLTWEAAPVDAEHGPSEGFIIVWGTESGQYTNESTEILDECALWNEIGTFVNGVMYYFAVKAFNSSGESGLSNEVFYDFPWMPPGTPTILMKMEKGDAS